MSKQCFYPNAFEGKAEVVRWFYSRNNGCEVFFACSKEVSDAIEAESWADVSREFTVYVEHELMPFCVENTDWNKCYRYGIEYNEKVNAKDRHNCPDTGCVGTSCHCEPFGEGDFTYGIADDKEIELFNNYLNRSRDGNGEGMHSYQNALEIATNKMQLGEITVDQANVLVVQMMGVRVISNKLPASVRKALNAAVKAGELGHIKKEGLKPEVYHHKNARAKALELRNREMRDALETLAKVSAKPDTID